jgi:[histone H3]-lysine36 N-dimethyltransferase SETMAR
MDNFVPNKQHLREVLLYLFNVKKSAAESYRLLCEAYGEHALAESTCREWFRRFKSKDFDVKDQIREGAPKHFEDEELEALLDEDPCQTEKELAKALNVTQQCISPRLNKIGVVLKQGIWLPHDLKERDIERRKTICEMLLMRHKRKSFLHRIVTGDEKWIHYDNPKRQKAWVRPCEAAPSKPKRNIHGSKVMLCIWWDQKGVIYYELLKNSESINGERYQQQLVELNRALEQKRPDYAKRHNKLILQHDNARPHVAKRVQETLEELNWEILPHPPYSPDCAPSDYHLFRSMQNALSGERFHSYEDTKKWVDEWIASKEAGFFYRGIHLLPEKWHKVVDADGKYFE